MSDVTDLIQEAKDLKEASDATYANWRKEGKEDLLMKAGEAHWPGTTQREREAENRPALTVNQLPQFSQRVVGEFRLNQFAIALKAADSVADPKVAEILEGLIRAINYDSLAKIAYRFALQNAADCGMGWLRVSREYESEDAWEQVIKVLPVYNPFSIYPDANSVRYDLEDCYRLLVLEEMSLNVYKQRWPKANIKDIDGGTGNEKRLWTNENDKSITVGEFWRKVPTKKKLALIGDPMEPDNPTLWTTIELTKEKEQQLYQEGDLVLFDTGGGYAPVIRQKTADTHKLQMCLLSGADVLDPVQDQPGRYLPFVPVMGEEVHVDGQRRIWGLIRHAKEPQRIWNYQWTAAVEAVGLQPKVPYVGTEKQFDGHESEWDAANRGNMSRLTYKPDPQAPGPPQRQAPPVTPVAALALVEKAEQMLRSTTGVYDPSLGKPQSGESGVLNRQRQATSSVLTATYSDNLTLAMEHLTRIEVDLIPYIYPEERVVRILGEDYTEDRRVRINGSGAPDITRGRYDVVATIGPAYATRREQSFTAMNEFGKNMGPQSFIFVADKIAALSDVPGKDDLVDRIKKIQAMQGFTEDGQPPPQMMDTIMQTVQQAIQQMVPQPEQIQQLVVKTLEQLAGGARQQPGQGEVMA